jgi:hypothetical protein
MTEVGGYLQGRPDRPHRQPQEPGRSADARAWCPTRHAPTGDPRRFPIPKGWFIVAESYFHARGRGRTAARASPFDPQCRDGARPHRGLGGGYQMLRRLVVQKVRDAVLIEPEHIGRGLLA